MRYLLVMLLLFVFNAYGQQNDLCSNATVLCGGQSVTSSNVGATASCGGEDGPCSGQGLFCFGVNNTIWLTFTTNQTGGNASVNIENITSVNGDDTLQLAVVSATSPCVPSTFSSVACINSIASASSLPLNNLQPNTQYWIVVDGKGSPPPAGEAVFQISVTGPAVQSIVSLATTSPSGCSINDGSIQATASSGSTFSLNGSQPQSSGTFNNLAPGTYSLTVQYATGCDTTVNIVLPSATITDAQPIVTPSDCNQANGTVTITNTQGGTRPYLFTMNSVSQTDSVFSGLAPGTYQVQVTDASDPSCVFTVNATIIQDVPVTTVGTSNTDCGASTGKIIASSTGASSPYTYSLLPSAGSQSGNTFTGLAAGTYNLITTSANGCSDTLPVSILERFPVTDVEVATEDVNCTGAGMGSASVTSVLGGKAPYQYSVDGAAFQSSTSFPLLPSGVHTITVKDANGCEYETTFAISTVGSITCSAGADMIKYPGVSVTLQGTASDGDIYWSPSTGLSDSTILEPEVNPSSSQIYTMFVVTSNGCTCRDEVFVEVAPKVVPVPNAFTPNADGANDVWRIPNLEYYDDCIVDVYTRWGQRVFHSEGYEIGEEWEGQYMGLHVPAGNYYYVINLNIPLEGATNLITGTVVIIK